MNLWYNTGNNISAPRLLEQPGALVTERLLSMTIPDPTTDSRLCRTCGIVKPLTPEFWHRDKTDKLGFCYTCKECAKNRARQWTTANSDRNKERCKARYVAKKHEYQAYRSIHADKIREEKRAWRKANPEKVKKHKSESQKRHRPAAAARLRKFAHSHPEVIRIKTEKRRARKLSLPDTLTAAEWEFALRYFGNACAYCGSSDRITADHFIPLNSPECPGTIAENMIPACHACNSGKKDRDPVEWLTERFGSYRAHEILAVIGAYSEYVI